MEPYRRAPRTTFERTGRLPLRTASRPVRRGDYLARRPRRSTRLAIARPLSVEKKGMDTDIDVTAIISTTNTNANAFVLNLIQAGTGSWNRVGRKTHLKSVRLVGQINWAFVPNTVTGALDGTYVRMVLVWDKQPSGAAIPLFNTIFGTTSQAGVEACNDISEPLRYDNMDRFRVIRDCIIEPQAQFTPSFGTGPYLAAPTHFDEYVKLNNLESVYSGQSVPMTIADISTGALYLYFRTLKNLATITANSDAIARLRFTD